MTGDNGKLVYLAPEETHPLPTATLAGGKATDMFRFGALLYWLHENRMPFTYKELEGLQNPAGGPNYKRFFIKGENDRSVRKPRCPHINLLPLTKPRICFGNAVQGVAP